MNRKNTLIKYSEIKNKDGKKLSQYTYRNYKNIVNVLFDLIPNIFIRILNNENIYPFLILIKKKYPKNYHIYISTISKFINYYDIKLKDDNGLKKIQNYIKRGVNKQTEKIDKKVDNEKLKITFEDYRLKVKQITKDEKVPIEIKILFNLYLYIPLRDDFGNVLIVEKDLKNDTNFYNIKTNIFHLNNYKTKRNYGNKKFKLNSILKNLIKINYDTGNKYMISNTKKLSLYFTRNSIRYLKIKLNINDIRKAKIESFKNKSIKEKKQLSTIMLHDYNVQQNIYKRE